MSTTSKTPILGLLVAGGQSTRMGSDKCFLPYPTRSRKSDHKLSAGNATDDTIESLWIHLVRILLDVCPEGVVVSHNANQKDRMIKELQGSEEDWKPRVTFSQDAHEYSDIGPAAGLITAYDKHPDKTFLAVAVDFPFITLQTLQDLLGAYKEPVSTYFHPIDMHPEPLLSIWSPLALERLKKNAVEGIEVDAEDGRMTRRKRTGPCFTAKQLWKELAGTSGGDEVVGRWGILPRDERELRNTNTREEWDRAVEELKEKRGTR